MFLDLSAAEGYLTIAPAVGGKETNMACIKSASANYDDLSKVLRYDPDTGLFTWLVSPAKNVAAGSYAGSPKKIARRNREGDYAEYLYIKYDGYEYTGARVAWLLTYKEWPEGNVRCKDGDTLNLRLNNLEVSKHQVTKVDSEGKKRRVTSREAMRSYGLRRYYGLTLSEYTDKHLRQRGVCAICGKPETTVLHGKIKPLSVDHDHTTGAIRDLLCHSCNHGLGHFFDNRDTLLAAVRYLDKHAEQSNIVSLDPQEVANA